MKKIEILLYSFSELSQEAKEYALNKWNENNDYHFGDEALESLKKFAEHFNAELRDWSIDYLEGYRSHVKFVLPEPEPTEKELKEMIKSMGSYNKKTLRGLGDCKFTGVCFDENCADGAREAFVKGERNLLELLFAGYGEWHRAVTGDVEYQMSEEAFAETCEANEYTFEENGKMRNA